MGHYSWYFYSYDWLYQSSCPGQTLGECSNGEQLMHDTADVTADAGGGDAGGGCGGILGMNVAMVNLPVRLLKRAYVLLCTNNTRTSGYVGIVS